MTIRSAIRAAATLAILARVIIPAAPAAAATATQTTGYGSTWSQPIIDIWRADVAKSGLPINYQGNGSTAGRQYYITGTADFAVSEIPFQSNYCVPGTGCTDEVKQAAARPYVYIPIAAGGTSFLYNLSYAGQQVHDLKLSGATITKIYTAKITNWDDAAITADDGRHFASEPIIPVIRSDGSGTGAQFTAWMAATQPALWQPFCAQYGIVPCGATSQYPQFPGSTAQKGSDGVAGFVSGPQGKGAIGYAEYSYALNYGVPAISVQNAAGYYVQPNTLDVAVGLQAATTNPDNTQNLNGVYFNKDPRAYPVSSYSLLIAPTTTAAPFTTDMGYTLSQFINFAVCTGQQQAGFSGYSYLPQALVQVAFAATARIPGAVPAPSISQCANPLITGAFKIPPLNGSNTPAGQAANNNTATKTNGAPTSTTAHPTAAAAASAAAASPGASSSAAAGQDPGTTDTVAADTGSPVPDQLAAASSPQKVAGGDSVPVLPFLLVALIMLGVVFIPPTVSVLRRRDTGACLEDSSCGN